LKESMPKHIDIGIYQIARTQVVPEEVERWLKDLGAVSFADEFISQLSDDSSPVLSEPAGLIALAAKRCYMSFEPGLNPNVTRVRKEYVDYFDNILKSGHGSVLEHATFTFALEGVSRVFTAEMNRHRAGWAISEGSLRFIRFDQDIGYWVPTSLQGNDVPFDAKTACALVDDHSSPLDTVLAEEREQNLAVLTEFIRAAGSDGLTARKAMSRVIFDDVFAYVEWRYKQLLTIWDMDSTDKNFAYKKAVTSALRRIVPLGVATGGVWTGNVRALRHVLAMRCSPAAEEEILHVFSRIAEVMVTAEPLLFGDFSKETGHWVPKYPKV
jgi:thymidylate synthase (FAD)